MVDGAASDVFISYKAEDRKRLKPLVDALEAEGFSVWWDQHIGGGTNWREEIERHLDAAKVVVVVWSDLTIGPQGRFVRDEAGAAQEAGHYLPITIDDVRPPLGFREVQALDLSNWWGKRSDPRFKVLADTIRHRLEGGDIAPRALAVSKGPAVSRRTAIAGGAGVAVAAAAGGFFLLKPSAANAKRIAVLPFANLSGANEDYFADGLAEELRGALSRAGLQVIGRNSSEAVAKDDVATIGEKLNVGHVLTGSVRQSADTLRVSAQLVNAKDGAESWSQNYDRVPGDAIKIQSDIAEQVASALSIAIGVIKQAVELGGTDDPAVQMLVQQTAEIFKQKGTTPESLREARKLTEQAVARDPKFAKGWISLGIIKVNVAAIASSREEAARFNEESERDIRRGIALAPGIAAGHAALASLAGNRLRLSETLAETRKSIKAEPNGVAILVSALNLLPWLGDHSEAAHAATAARSLDPLNPTAFSLSSQAACVAGRVDEGLAYSRQAYELAPQNDSVTYSLAYASLLAGQNAQAVQAMSTTPPDDFWRMYIEGVVAARARNFTAMEKIIAALRSMHGDFASYQYAVIYAQAGKIDQAFEALDTALKVNDPGSIQTMRDPYLKPLRKDPRFLALIKRLKFPIIDRGIGEG